MKNLLKALVPASIRQKLRKRRADQDWSRLMAAWDSVEMPGPHGAAADANPPAILILPSDLGQITGALGDDAMITATLEQAQARIGSVRVDMIGMPVARGVIEDKGFHFVELPAAAQLPEVLAACFRARRYAAVIVLGADILDGYYNPTAALTRLVCADLAARAGAPVTVLGGSFNKSPAPGLKPAFERLDKAVRLHMRDEISLARIRGFADTPARLVADSAFTLTPTAPDPAAADWIAAERAGGRTVLGLNVHPMLIKNASPAQVEHIIAVSAEAVARVSAQREVSWVMIPHDYRGERGDARCLRPIHDALSGKARSFFLDGEHRAAALKGLAGLTDGVVTGRMHLAIAALGMGVPTLSLTYQDKFEGLYRHFTLPEALLLAPDIFDDTEALAAALRGFIDDLPALRETVASRKPEVKRLAEINFDAMGPLPRTPHPAQEAGG